MFTRAAVGGVLIGVGLGGALGVLGGFSAGQVVALHRAAQGGALIAPDERRADLGAAAGGAAVLCVVGAVGCIGLGAAGLLMLAARPATSAQAPRAAAAPTRQ